LAVPVGVAAAAVQVIGLLRWPLLVPSYAADATSPDPTVAAAARDSFTTAHHLLGNVAGETLGYSLTAVEVRPYLPGSRRSTHERLRRLSVVPSLRSTRPAASSRC